jgi:hypothetical protein
MESGGRTVRVIVPGARRPAASVAVMSVFPESENTPPSMKIRAPWSAGTKAKLEGTVASGSEVASVTAPVYPLSARPLASTAATTMVNGCPIRMRVRGGVTAGQGPVQEGSVDQQSSCRSRCRKGRDRENEQGEQEASAQQLDSLRVYPAFLIGPRFGGITSCPIRFRAIRKLLQQGLPSLENDRGDGVDFRNSHRLALFL